MKRRTRRGCRTGCPPTAASATSRSYRLWTLRERPPQPGQADVVPRPHGPISSTPSIPVIRSITTPARCGNRTDSIWSHIPIMICPTSRSHCNTRNHTTRCVALARTRQRRHHPDLPSCRPRTEGEGTRPNPITQWQPRPIPATRQPHRLARSALIMPTWPAPIPCPAGDSATTSA